ncbi:hypothetical protein [Polaromonas eurypsychrophila]|uniref:hypothetical protein n=1 Tax=Polaromonas eurypsychrophila TaxID=1614635 RepID=UPI001662A2E6|nr:hypothetical protein [Polaromonas eurypsychrophila]
MTHLSIELPSRFQDSRPGDLLANEDKTPVGFARAYIGRAAWPFLVGTSRSTDSGQRQGGLAGESGFSS